MYRKAKNVVSGLAFSLAAICAGLIFGEPVVPPTVDTALPAPATAIRIQLPELQITIEQDGPATRLPASGTFQMPYFSFGSMLPRSPAES